MTAERAMLGTVDYFFFALMLLISAGIGVYFRFAGGKQRTTDEFLLAGKNMSILPVAFSLMATTFSAITVLGMPAEMYKFGIHLALLNVGNVAGVVLSSYLFLPVFFKVRATTAYEYLERRFGKKTRLMCSLSFVAQMMLYMSVVLYAPALALSAVTNLSTWASVISIGTVCTFYCTLGGMKAVLWTDVFQAILMYLCLFAVLVKGCMDAGGIGNVFRIASEGGRLQMPGTEIDPRIRYTIWNVFLQGFVISMSAVGGNQVQIQRLLTVKNVKRSRRALFLSIPMFVTFSLMNCLAGIVIYANLAGCDPLSSEEKPISSADQLMPYFIMKSLGHIPGLPGICICGVFSAALSTVSSAVNSLTAVTMEDFVKPLCIARKTDHWKVAMFAKAITLLYGALCISLTFLVANFGDLVQASFTVYGIFAGPVFGVFFLGMMTTRSNEKGAIVGLVTSVMLTAWISFGASSSAPSPKTLPLSTAECLHTQSSPPNFTEIISGKVMHDIYEDVITATYSAAPPERSHITLLSTYVNSSSIPDDENERYVFPLYTISYMLFVVIGFLASLVVGYIGSLCTDLFFGKSTTPEVEYISPFRRWFNKSTSEETSKAKQTNGSNEMEIFI